jgi:hypothetical protein
VLRGAKRRKKGVRPTSESRHFAHSKARNPPMR